MTVSSVFVRPPLKWAGGKRWQLPHLRPYWEANQQRRLVEPFCGGLAVTLGLMPDRALLNDVNPHVVNFYRWLQRGLVIETPMENSATTYYAKRERFNQLLEVGEGDSLEAASLFYYLNRTGYNGLCRFNSSGRFNVPLGRYANIKYRTDFLEFKAIFADWTFTSTDFDRIPLSPDDFIYADPPYDVEFTAYSRGGFGWLEQERTARFLAKHGGPVILSNQGTHRIKELYSDLGYRLTELKAPRRISCTGDRRPASEVLATRNV
ncbi:MAG: Dam family site-specific DNA-(adenine-N6)-methyltransferase [Gammaproteobacteria bacterium]|nr:Dam family site-specific DNA-(adenine-N6)-methyltransferase [Gammaproteobacteria bacterium]